MGVVGGCQCGAVRIEVPRAPDWVASCNCSLCTRLAWLVAYYPDGVVRVEGETIAYVWGDRMIGIHHCPVCGCGTHWRTLGEDFGRMGVNARLLDGFDPAAVEVRLFDNADRQEEDWDRRRAPSRIASDDGSPGGGTARAKRPYSARK